MVIRAHSGRRPGDSGTRDAILAAARRQFAELGYDRTSMRQVAIEAGVDPTLVSHFHGSKVHLFLAVVELSFLPPKVLPMFLVLSCLVLASVMAPFSPLLLNSGRGSRADL